MWVYAGGEEGWVYVFLGKNNRGGYGFCTHLSHHINWMGILVIATIDA